MLRTRVYSKNDRDEFESESLTGGFTFDDAAEEAHEEGTNPTKTIETESQRTPVRLVVVAQRENGRLLCEYFESLDYLVTIVPSISEAAEPLTTDVAAVVVDGDTPGLVRNYEGTFAGTDVPIVTLARGRLNHLNLPWRGLTLEKPVEKAHLGDTVRAITSTARS